MPKRQTNKLPRPTALAASTIASMPRGIAYVSHDTIANLENRLIATDRELRKMYDVIDLIFAYGNAAAPIDKASADALRELEVVIAEVYLLAQWAPLPQKRPDHPDLAPPHPLAGVDNRLTDHLTDFLRAQDAGIRLLTEYNLPIEMPNITEFVQTVSQITAGVQAALNYDPEPLRAFCAAHHGWRFAELMEIKTQLPRSPRPPGMEPHRRLILDTWRALMAEIPNLSRPNAIRYMLDMWTENEKPRRDVGPNEREAGRYLLEWENDPGKLWRNLTRDEKRAKS